MIKDLLIKKARGESEEEKKIYNKFILCKIKDIGFLIQLKNIREIMNIAELSPVPGVGFNVLGVLNLRGLVVPVIDIRDKFGIGEVLRTPLSRYVIVNIDEEPLGLFVDEAQLIISITSDDYIDVEDHEDYFTDYVQYEDTVLGVLDIKKIFIDYKI